MLATLLKGLSALALVGGIGLELGSPLLLRLQLDDAAHRAADDAVRDLGTPGGAAAARERALVVAGEAGADLTAFSVDPDGRVRVKLAERARSILLDRVEPLRSWYEVEVEATSAVGADEV